jgi:hypothetical protein
MPTNVGIFQLEKEIFNKYLMNVNIVTNFQLIGHIKTSRYFRVSLGLIPTVEKNGARKYNDKDKFSFFYNNSYNTTIYGQGNAGNIRFYTDHYITEPILAVYYGDNFEEFLFDFDFKMFRDKGMDFYLGHILKEMDIKYEEKKKNDELKKLEEKEAGNPDLITKNPGSVSYADIEAYLEKKRQERYKG